MDVLKVILLVVIGLLAVYLAARLITTAYFNSKSDYMSRLRNLKKEVTRNGKK